MTDHEKAIRQVLAEIDHSGGMIASIRAEQAMGLHHNVEHVRALLAELDAARKGDEIRRIPDAIDEAEADAPQKDADRLALICSEGAISDDFDNVAVFYDRADDFLKMRDVFISSSKKEGAP